MSTRSTQGFTLIELMIVTVIVGLLAGIAAPRFDRIREKGFDASVLSDLHNAGLQIERYFLEKNEYPGTIEDLESEGYVVSPGVTFTRFSIRNASDPSIASIHMHAEHEGSAHYYHFEYPGTSAPEQRWK